jgi:hypothetical protein
MRLRAGTDFICVDNQSHYSTLLNQVQDPTTDHEINGGRVAEPMPGRHEKTPLSDFADSACDKLVQL